MQNLKHLFFAVPLLLAGVARADSLTANQIAQELKQDSVLSLRQNVAGVWAVNLLSAQAGASYASPESLDLSIAAVERAIGLELSIAGLSFCNLTNCIFANQQSLIAVNPGASLGVTPNDLFFAETVPSPEPGTWWLLALAGIALALGWSYNGRRPRGENFASVHTARKA
jgi:hypothetical protein